MTIVSGPTWNASHANSPDDGRSVLQPFSASHMEMEQEQEHTHAR
jgi:hypothetical protein